MQNGTKIAYFHRYLQMPNAAKLHRESMSLSF